jgi:hypothetical protein
MGEAAISPNAIGEVFGSPTVYGTVQTIASNLHCYYSSQGYSLSECDLVAAIINNVVLYAAYAPLLAPNLSQVSTTINEDMELYVSEWATIESCVRAEIELINARRVDAMRSQGLEAYGLSVSEANSMLTEARSALHLNAFNGIPFSVDTGGEV